MATKKNKSSLASHQIPPFYACYLLKSIRTPRSCATYIGSTPSPPRRIRQHNGEISQGAWKTKNNRPWVMQMIVHGFPSKLAALQFEWAWQHPYISRHLRDGKGKALFSRGRSRYIKMNIQVVRTMISCHPYNTWPLHVKFFTEEALKIWDGLSQGTTIPPLPRGFTYQVEFEGVDGKSGKVGTGRTGAIDVSDETFTSGHVTKHKTLLASGKQLQCSICGKPMESYADEPLRNVLCPAKNCTAVSHLLCLSKHFLEAQSDEDIMVPRGGHCRVCQTYTLWGDVVKGVYRRHAGKAASVTEEDQESDEGELFASDTDNQEDPPEPGPSSPMKGRAAKRVKTKATTATHVTPTQGPPKKSKSIKSNTKKGKAPQVNTAPPGPSADSDEEEYFDLNAISADDEEDDAPPAPQRHVHPTPSRSRGAARRRAPGPSRSKAGPSRLNPSPKRNRSPPSPTTQGEFFDLNAISDDTEDDGAPPAPSRARMAGATHRNAGKSAARGGTPPAHPPAKSPTRAPRRKPAAKAKERPQFNIFDFPEDNEARGDPLQATTWPARASSPSIEFPEFRSKKPAPRPRPGRRRGQLVLQDGEEDFFANETQAIAPSSGSEPAPIGAQRARNIPLQHRKRHAQDSPEVLTRAMSAISVSSPSPTLGNAAAADDDVDIISLSD
ncbi:hypothetical protein DENSPDRAFT_146391 [Dentipellis sp. KUC8613]|nr:hypothetical protein DENSPDRAFT_146391 [Dentipellis sp. KUC8613]